MSTIMVLLCLCLTGCEKKHEPYVSPSTTIRDNTPKCLVPEAPGTVVAENELVKIDMSNSSEGYFIFTYLGESSEVKLQVTGPDYMTYTYDIHDNNPETFPISAGNGEYTIGVFENVDGNQYATIFSENFNFEVTNTFGAFLYPNQYVKFNKDSEVVAKAVELVAPAHDDLEAINYVYNYLVENITYDQHKAETVESGYIPDVDHILEIKTGICLDYAAVMSSMLRSQQIPVRMEIGYAGSAYHAWISCYVTNIGWINGIIQFDGVNWSLMDPTVAANMGEEKLKTFIGDGKTYMTKFIY
ncbi:MAG: transglutaminase-like domain-containing protein [Lachnospiraceae bacterium]|nr:transglutaminase-like domain-containing protein [Lachnospiraceae bacterium]